ncbi:MAG: peptide deformylase [Acidobacteriota bacterium]
MAIIPILKYGEPLLLEKSLPVEKVDEEIRRLIDDMVETMYASEGIGLAAPQVGELKRIIMVDISSGEKPEELVVLINPEIEAEEGSVITEEGCLSFPDLTLEIERPRYVRVRGLSPEGKELDFEAEGLLACALSHEIDHLNGVLIINRASPLKRDLMVRKIRKKIREGEW